MNTGPGHEHEPVITQAMQPESKRNSLRWTGIKALEGAVSGSILAAAVLGIPMYFGWNLEGLIEGHFTEAVLFLGTGALAGVIKEGVGAFRKTIKNTPYQYRFTNRDR